MEESTTADTRLGSVLVIGGCGFVGFHLVRHLLLEHSCTSVSVISRNPQRNRLSGVSYHAGDITDAISLRALILQIQPQVIIHAACPSPITGSPKEYRAVTVQGTSNLLKAASSLPSVKAFIFTSSSTMAAGPEHITRDESTALADTYPASHPYAKTKAVADKLVLAANTSTFNEKDGSGLRTACIRLPIVYGERDVVAIPGALFALQKGHTRFQLGPGTNQWDFASVENAAIAHILVAKALLATEPSLAGKVDGEAFNISDGERHYFWDFPHVIWKAAGAKVPPPERVIAVPTWLALLMAGLLEWLFWFVTFGMKRPGIMGRQQVEYSCFTHTYSIDKARERLGYAPVPNFEEGIRKAVAWSLAEDGWSERLNVAR